MNARRRRLLLSLLLTLLFSSTSARAQSHVSEYVHGYGSTNVEHAYAVTVDAADNVFVIGSTTGSIDMGGGALPAATNNGALVLAKYDPSGSHLWSVLLGAGGSGILLAWDLDTDAAGNVYTCGRVSGTTDFGGGTLGSGTSSDVFLAKFSGSTGTHLWSQSFGDGDFDQAFALSVDTSDDVVLLGRFRSTIDFGGGVLTSAASADLYVAKFSSAGVHQWSTSFPDPGSPYAESVTTDGSDNIYFGGTFTSIDFGGGLLTATGISDAFLVKLDASGSHVWSTAFPSTSVATILAVESDAAGNTAFGGEYEGTLTFGSSVLPVPGAKEGFVGRCDPSGNVQWAHAIAGPNNDRVTEVRVDPSGGILATGYFYENADVGGGPSMVGPSTGVSIYVVGYETTGAYQWNEIVTLGNISHLAVDSASSFYFFGEFSGSITVDTTSLTSLGATDFVLAKYAEDMPIPVLLHSFDATLHGGEVEVAWRMGDASGLDRYALVRSERSSVPRIVDSGPVVVDGVFRDTDVRPGHDYEYELRVTSRDGFEQSAALSRVSVPRFVSSLEQNTPNPFNPRTTISFTLAAEAEVALEIFDLSGALVRRIDGGTRGPGSHEIEWDGTDGHGQRVASGNYYYRVAGMDRVATRKMTLVK